MNGEVRATASSDVGGFTWLVTEHKKNDLMYLQFGTENFAHWTEGFVAFVKAHSPCQIFIGPDFLSDDSDQFNKA